MLSNAFQSFRARLIRVQQGRRPRYTSRRHARAAHLVQLPSSCHVSTETLEDRLMLSASPLSASPTLRPSGPSSGGNTPGGNTTQSSLPPSLPPTGGATPLMAPSGTPMTTTVTWTGGAGTTNWTDAANWSTDALPGAGDDVVINVATATTIHIASATVSVNSV